MDKRGENLAVAVEKREKRKKKKETKKKKVKRETPP